MAKKGYSLGSLSDYVDTKVPKTQTINGKPLSEDITLTPADVKSVALDGSSKMTGTLQVETSMGVVVKNPTYPGIVFWATSIPDSVQKKYVEVSPDGSLDIVTRSADGKNSGVVTLAPNKSGEIYHTGNKPTPEDINAVSRDQVNFSQGSSWAEIIGKIPTVGKNGVMEVGKYIDLREKDSGTDYDVRLTANGAVGNQCMSVSTVNGFIDIGAKTASGAHIYTDRPKFEFNKCLGVHTGYGISIESGTDPRIELHKPGQVAYAMVAASNNSFELWQTNGSGTWVKTLIRVQADGSFWCLSNGDFNDVYIRSDKRLKTDLKPLEGALEKVCKLQGYTYDKHTSLTDDTIVGREVGILAQDLEVVLPEATHTAEDTQMTISNSGVNALLVEAIKELTAKVEMLERKLEERS